MDTTQPLIALDFASLPALRIFPDVTLSWYCAYSIDEVLPTLHAVWEACLQGHQAVGWLSYEAAPAFDTAFRSVHYSSAQLKALGLPPLLAFAVFDPSMCVRSDVHLERSDLSPEWSPLLAFPEFYEQLDAVQTAMLNGELYQANLTYRLHTSVEASAIWPWYCRMAQEQKAGYNAFISHASGAILSCSPELFFDCDHQTGRVITRPMKGTVQRASDSVTDQSLAEWLYASEKNRAENVMIVDLLRNDLSKVANQVSVPALFDIECYPSVWQMTSTVEGVLKSGKHWIDVIQALFPCGSVVGAPKLKASEWIHRLESTPRGVYCGAVGWVSAERAVFNVPIRTTQWDAATRRAVYGVGNGLTVGSSAQEEWQEMQIKTRFLHTRVSSVPAWSLIETLYWSPVEGFRHLALHLIRLLDSACYWQWIKSTERDVWEAQIRAELSEWEARALTTELPAQRMRLLVARSLTKGLVWTISSTSYEEMPLLTQRLVLAPTSIPEAYDRRWLCHKTTHRVIYDEMQAYKPEWAWDVVLWNASGELTEGTIGNIALELDGIWYTPPVSSGLLPGIARQCAINDLKLKERVLYVHDIKRATRCVWMNSLRGWIDVSIEELSV